MARVSTISLLLWILSLGLLGSVADARETMGEKARRLRGRSPRPRRVRTDDPVDNDYRFMTNATSKYFVDSLPDIDFDLGEIYSGQIPVKKNDTSRNLFFVYQPTTGEPVDEVTIWFNGGPGCSSLEGFLQENGRFIWSWGMYNALENPYSWVNLTNMLWVEFPVGLGFSTGNVTATSEEEVAQDFLGFFKNFQDIFGISNFKIYVTGESYAGRYVPYVSAAMLDANDTTHFNLSGALMYDPVIGKFDYIGQTVPAVPFIEKNAQFFNFNQSFLETIHKAHRDCGYAEYIDKYMQFPPSGPQPALNTGFNNISASCDVYNIAHQAAFQPNPCFNVYEISDQCPFLFDPLSFPTDVVYNYPGFDGPYFNRSDVKTAIHAPQDVAWLECSGPVFNQNGPDPGQYGEYDLSADPIQKVLPQIIEATNRVLIGNGDYDYEILSEGTLLSIQNMTWNGHLGFQTAPCDDVNILLPDLQWQDAFTASGLGGWDGPGQGIMGTQHYERGLMFTTVSQSGHMIPQFQPRVSYRHMQWLLGRIDSL